MNPAENVLKLKDKLIKKNKNDNKKKADVVKIDTELLIIISSLFISASSVFFEFIIPFWFPLCAYVFFYDSSKSKFVAASALVFLFTLGFPAFLRSVIYILGLIGLNVTRGIREKKFVWMLGSFILCFITGMLINLLYKESLIRGVYVLAESLCTIGMFYIYQVGFPTIFNYSNKTVFSNEEIITINLIISIMINGFSSFEIYNINIAYVFSVCAILLCVHYFDLAFAMVQAITTGMFISLSLSGNFYIISVLAVCAVFSSLLERISSFGSIIIFIIVGSGMSLYLNRTLEFIISPLEMLLGGAMFICIIIFLGDDIIIQKKNNAKMQAVFDDAIKRVIKEQILTQKGMLKEISNNMSVLKEVSKEDTKDTMLRVITSDICSGCNMYSRCWKDDPEKTYSNFIKVMDLYSNDSSVAYNMLPKSFIGTCNKGFIMFKVISYLSDFQRLKNNYILKINKFKELISLQFTHMSRVLDLTYKQMEKGITTDTIESIKISAALEREGLKVEKVIVLNDFNDNLKIFLRPKEKLNKEYLRKNVANIISEILQKSISYEYTLKPYDEDTLFEYVFCEDTIYTLSTGLKRCPKNEGINSGDNYSDVILLNNKQLVALCDGMGSGLKAGSQSTRVLNILEDLLNGNTEEALAIKTINSLLVLEEDEEIFSTLDMMLFDLNTSEASFIKAGAVASYIKRDNEIIKIQKDCLPIGIIENINIKKQTFKLKNGDIVIFMSDGFLSAINNDEEWLIEKLSSINVRNPQKIADELYDEAMEMCSNNLKDDLTILVSKVREQIN